MKDEMQVSFLTQFHLLSKTVKNCGKKESVSLSNRLLAREVSMIVIYLS